MKLTEFSTRRPVSVFIFTVAAVVFGLIAFTNLATDLLPDISYQPDTNDEIIFFAITQLQQTVS